MERFRVVGSDQTFQELSREKGRNDVFSDWFKQRADILVTSVTAHDVLRHFGVTLKGSDDAQEQISCPFHGEDRKPSARIYPSAAGVKSGVYCWTCQKRWDIFGLWKGFHGDDGMKFPEIIKGLERAFGIIPPEMPTIADDRYTSTSGPSEEQVRTLDVLEVCERRLKMAKPFFTLKGFMTIGKLLDQLHFAVIYKPDAQEQVRAKAHVILDKIGEKIRGA